MLLIGHMDSASSSSSTLHDCDLDYETSVDERIRKLVSSVRLSARRNKILHDGEEDELKKIHLRLENLVFKEPDIKRRRRLLRLLPTSNRFRELLFYLRKLRDLPTAVTASRYMSKMHEELTAVMSQSFEEEYRKFADLLGVMESLAEVLICDVDLFGVKCLRENTTIRKLIANSLTNLSFGSSQRKRRLCSYPNFIEYVVKVVSEMQVLAQAYAALLRNLSWNADAATSKQLRCTVPTLIQASMRAHSAKDSKCLCATLSALWNMSCSLQNQQTICQNARFLETLVDLLVYDPQQTAVAEAATGVLKYASQCFSQNTGEYLHVNVLQKLVLRLVDLLKSSSFTTINNCLYVLQQLLKHDYHLRVQIRLNQKAMPILYHLCNSKVVDVKNTVKTILEYLDAEKCQALIRSFEGTRASAAISARAGIMTSSCDGRSVAAQSFFDTPRLLKLRVTQRRTSSLFSNGDDVDEGRGSLSSNAPEGPVSHRSIPSSGISQHHFGNHVSQNGHLSRNCFNASRSDSNSKQDMSDYENLSFGRNEKTTYFGASRMSQRGDVSEDDGDDIDFDESETENNHLLEDPSFEIEESICCSRNSSAQSLTSMSLGHRNGWNSCNNSAANSNQFSPVSASDLPDSPSQYTIPTASTLSSIEKDKQPDSVAMGYEKGHEKAGPQNSVEDEGDYGNFDSLAISDLLNSSIEAAMPKRTEINDEFLTNIIEQAQPKVPMLQKKSLSDSAQVATTPDMVATNSSLPSCDILYLACV